MKVIDVGHKYSLTVYDGNSTQQLTFMKRMGHNYPFNTTAYAGTNCQEVLRALIDRINYLDLQVPCWQNPVMICLLRLALWLLELRAAKNHERKLHVSPFTKIELLPTCEKCGHIDCLTH